MNSQTAEQTFQVRQHVLVEVTYTVKAHTWEEAKESVEEGIYAGEGEELYLSHDVTTYVGNADTGEILWEKE